MIGTRVYLDDPNTAVDAKPGEYWRDSRGRWMCCIPIGEEGMLGNLSGHEVVENEDGTITVAPSILVTGGSDGLSWHGYLERGVWREC